MILEAQHQSLRLTVATIPAEHHALFVDLERFSYANGLNNKDRRYAYFLPRVDAKWMARCVRAGFHVAVAFVLLLEWMPSILLMVLLATMSGGGIRREERLGRWGKCFFQYELYFPPRSALWRLNFFGRLPLLLNVLKREMAFIGPRAVPPSVALAESREAWMRYTVRPGMMSLWTVRKRANMAYSSEMEVDLEYAATSSIWGDVGITLRALPGLLFRGGPKHIPAQISFLGVSFDNLTMAEASKSIVDLTRSGRPEQICFVNADCVNIACNDTDYRKVLGRARLVLADGIGVRIAGMLFNQNVRENVNGTDLLPFLCAAAQEEGLGIYILGGRPGVPEGAGDWMRKNYPDLRISGIRNGYFSDEEQQDVVADIACSGANIVLVALGAPKQDKWILEHRHELGAKVMIGVGGLLDFYSGRIQRAPVWIRELGMEWFYRFSQEPRRMWRRYFLGNAVFLSRIMFERVQMRQQRDRDI